MRFVFLLVLLGTVLSSCFPARAQSPATPPASQKPAFTANYPRDRAGVFIQDADWKNLPNANPIKTKTKHSIAASLSYGMVPANIVAQYEGVHASVEIKSAKPIICLCHLVGLPGDPVIVKLHPKKNSRELDGGEMTVYPVVGGARTAEANRSDLIPVEVSQPDSYVWLVRPREELEAGEYALMLGTQNLSIFPFTVTVGAPVESFDKQ